MRSTFFGIELARRALFAQQRAMDVASHNIANANRPEYSRQRADMVATVPYAPPGMEPAGVAGQVGTGVWVREITRLRDSFVDARIRGQNQLSGYWQVRRDVLEQIERVLNEPSDNGLRVAFDRFWEALQELSVTPDSRAVREVVVQRGKVFTDSVRTVFQQLEALRVDLDRTLELKVDRLNTLAGRLAQINRQIGQISSSGQNPNDLLDERDAILEEMSRLASVTVTIRPPQSGSVGGEQVAVSIAGLTLVDGQVAHKLVMGGNGPQRTVHWESGAGPQVAFSGGEIQGYIEMRDTEIPGLMGDLDRWVKALGLAFNEQHQAGYGLDGVTGRAFFEWPPDGDSWVADDFQVVSGLTAEQVAAAEEPNAPGDNRNALRLAALLKTTPFVDSVPPGGPDVDLGGVTLPDYFASLVGRLGVDTQEAQTTAENQELLVNHLKGVRESVSGVSLDEEMADLVRFEHAYGAAARAMTAMDEVLDTLINRTGLVGR